VLKNSVLRPNFSMLAMVTNAEMGGPRRKRARYSRQIHPVAAKIFGMRTRL
jgi:hypothetical protein